METRQPCEIDEKREIAFYHKAFNDKKLRNAQKRRQLASVACGSGEVRRCKARGIIASSWATQISMQMWQDVVQSLEIQWLENLGPVVRVGKTRENTHRLENCITILCTSH
jgi:hypothetical protein